MADAGTLNLFTTRVHAFQLDHPLLPVLAARFVAEAQQTAGVDRSVRDGWHGPPDLWSRKDLETEQLRGWFLHRFERVLSGRVPQPRWSCQAWATVLTDGGYATPHDHAGAHWSSVFYLDAGDAPDSGHICFMDPRGPVFGDLPQALAPAVFDVQPKTGLMLIFPAFLRHYVHPYRGSRPRVAVACNARLVAQ